MDKMNLIEKVLRRLHPEVFDEIESKDRLFFADYRGIRFSLMKATTKDEFEASHMAGDIKIGNFYVYPKIEELKNETN